MMEFQGWPKIPRLYRDMTVTEKIDGTNAAVIVERHPWGDAADGAPGAVAVIFDESELDADGDPLYEWWVGAQSRKRVVTPESDNFGFAKWVQERAGELVLLLGEGRHFGEWWGSGIQRGYGLTNGTRFFSLFNTHRYADVDFSSVEGLRVVPVLDQSTFAEWPIEHALQSLAVHGSRASRGYMHPEGVVIYHHAAGTYFKVLLESDAVPKSILREEYALAA